MLCLECGSENPRTNSFCGVCGARLSRPLDVAAQPSALLGEILDDQYRIDVLTALDDTFATYLGNHLPANEAVSVAVLLTDEPLDAAAGGRMSRAARRVASLRHPYATGVIGAGVSSSQRVAYIVTEPASGRRLSEVIEEADAESRTTEALMLAVAGAVCSVLDKLHRSGLVHGDISPANILIDERADRSFVRLGGVGVFEILDQAGKHAANSLSPYSSPEQREHRPLDARSDIYSLGMVLYEILCGTVPFKSIPASAVAGGYAKSQAPPPLRLFNPAIPAGLEAAVLSAIANESEARPSTAGDLFARLAQAAGHATVPDDLPPARSDNNGIRDPQPAIEKQLIKLQPLLANDANGILEIEVGKAATGDTSEDLLEVYGPGIPVEKVEELEARKSEAPSEIPRPSEPVERPEAAESAVPGRMVPRFAQTEAVEDVPTSASTDETAPAPPRRRWFLYGTILMLIAIAFLAGILAGLSFFRSGPTAPDSAELRPELASRQAEVARTAPLAPPPGMVYIPGGDFMMGSDLGDAYSRPAHPVKVGAFFIDVTEVTNEDYRKFVDATGHQPPPTWTAGSFAEGEGRMPVTGVNWNDANAYAKWAGKRLPTEAEWEYAARGTDGRTYPWGEKWIAGYANAGIKATGLREVGVGGRSPFGLYDMAGNAWEWTSTDAAAYPGGKGFEPSDRSPKIIRGGSWKSRWTEVTAYNRAQWGAEGEADYSLSGFRCARDIIVE